MERIHRKVKPFTFSPALANCEAPPLFISPAIRGCCSATRDQGFSDRVTVHLLWRARGESGEKVHCDVQQNCEIPEPPIEEIVSTLLQRPIIKNLNVRFRGKERHEPNIIRLPTNPKNSHDHLSHPHPVAPQALNPTPP